VLTMWPCIRNLDEDKCKHAGFTEQNGFTLYFGLDVDDGKKG